MIPKRDPEGAEERNCLCRRYAGTETKEDFIMDKSQVIVPIAGVAAATLALISIVAETKNANPAMVYVSKLAGATITAGIAIWGLTTKKHT
jgi:hypothetical protein